MIHIDFIGGAHGNFLEFVCNVVAGVETNASPFSGTGTSHNKQYLSPPIFHAGHLSYDAMPLRFNRVIAIKITEDDLLPLSQISLLRAGDYGYDNNELEINTYHKLNNRHYRQVLDTLLDSFFTSQVSDSYNAVKDPSWPEVYTLSDFQNLPEHIRKECAEIHKLELLELSEEQPDCPRHILREFFQISFEHPESSGFMKQQQLMTYNDAVEVYVFPFGAFYDTAQFLDQIKSIATWANIQYTTQDRIKELHRAFLDKQPFKDSKHKCDSVVQQLINNTIQLPGDLTMMEEAYVNAMLRKNGYERRY